jgi:uncharacterized protein YrrD
MDEQPVPNDDVSAARPEQDDVPAVPLARVDYSEWHGKDLVDSHGDRIGKLEDVYFDIESDQPQFGTLKEGGLFSGRHLTFVPLVDVAIGPDYLQVAVTKDKVKDAPNIDLEGDELTQADESTLYHHYQLNYLPAPSPSGRRLVRH